MYLYFFIAAILAICAVVVRLNPNSVNVLSEADRGKMDPKKVGRIGFWGLMTTAALLVVLYFVGVPSEIGMFIACPCAIVIAGLIQASIK